MPTTIWAWNNAPEAGQPRAWQTIEPLDTTVVDNPQLVLELAASGDLAAEFGPYEDEFNNPENFDFIRVLTDDDGDGEFDVLTEFVAADEFDSDFPGFLAAEDGTILNPEFQTLTFDLPTSPSLDLRIDVFTNAGDEVIGIDNLRVIGEGTVVVGDCNGDGVVDVTDANCTPAEGLDDFLASNGLLRGDADGDKQVQFTDLVILSDNFGNPGQYTDGDFDKDGTVQFGDLAILAENFGQMAAATATVPEPSAAMLLLTVVIMLFRRRRR